jgi:hypothetical protein
MRIYPFLTHAQHRGWSGTIQKVLQIMNAISGVRVEMTTQFPIELELAVTI